MKVTRLAFGTGSMSGQVQQSLGQDQFTRLVRHAYDHGVRFFETSESYGETPRMLGVALKGLPRESYRIMTKVSTYHQVDPHVKLEELRKTIDTEYVDIMLLHWQHTPTWPQDTTHWQDAILAAEDEEDDCEPRSFGARAAGAAAGAGQQVARCGDDSHEPQRDAHGLPRLRTGPIWAM